MAIALSKLSADIRNNAQMLVTFLELGNLDPEQIRSLIARLETIAGIQHGLDEVNAGQTRPVADFAEEVQRKYNISS
ncbi:MAG: hypothetical protein AAFZ49_02025 [Cyanobacteria bacterium J06659_2]